MSKIFDEILDEVREEGIQKGEKRGLRKGMKEGLVKGKEEGILENSVSVAKESFSIGLTIEQIAMITKLPVEQLRQIQAAM